jgi:hypothetical protein
MVLKPRIKRTPPNEYLLPDPDGRERVGYSVDPFAQCSF